jgi:carbon-monoxide dehydrogenase medium subunit
MSLLHDIAVYTPASVEEALELLAERHGELRVVAGGTDLIVQMKGGAVPRSDLLNIFGLNPLRYVQLENHVLRIGALTTLAALAEDPLVQTQAPLLAQAAASIGSAQILNKASIGGNIVNASPAADTVPALCALEASVMVRSVGGSRTVPIERFYRGYKKLDLREDELVTEVRMAPMHDGAEGIYLKHGLRLGNACAVVNGAIWVKRLRRKRTVDNARIALGAVAPTVVRARNAEALLTGRELTESTAWRAASAVGEAISPVDDVRGSAAYRRELSIQLVYIGLWEILNRSAPA